MNREELAELEIERLNKENEALTTDFGCEDGERKQLEKEIEKLIFEQLDLINVLKEVRKDSLNNDNILRMTTEKMVRIALEQL